MPTRPIAFDLARLFYGAVGATPRGIDRVDLSFAHHLFDQQDPAHCGLVPTPARMGVVRPAEARAIVTTVDRHWRESRPLESDDQYASVCRWLANAASGPGQAAAPVEPRRRLPFHLAGMVGQVRLAGLRPAARAVPKGAVYLNTGQVLLGFPKLFGWLDRRPDVKPVFMMHDVIPLTFPEYSGPVLSRHHGRALANAAQRAAAMLATSEASAADLRAALQRIGRDDMPIHVVPLPVSPSLLDGQAGAGAPATQPFFVTVGIIDQRKNHRLLLHVWRNMLRDRGPKATPKLLIVGSRGLRTAGLLEFVERSSGLSSVVRVVSGLPSPAMRDVIRGARALLMPSFAEGFGLPVIEARALGVPVIASDIAAHREVGGAGTTCLDPLDGLGWERSILAHAEAPEPSPAAPDGGAPQTWARYFAAVMPFLDAL